MNTQIATYKQRKSVSSSIRMLLLSTLLLSSTSTLAANSFQQKVLFTPGNSMLLAEAKGRVMIYDGLKSETVETAMTEQFDRIQNMMFVRTQYVQENGEYEVDEDDCD